MNATVLADFLTTYGREVTYKAGDTLVSEGDFPMNVYFIKHGVAAGKRAYEDGTEYIYFKVDETNGNLGLLEVLARKETYISSVTCLTDTLAVKVPSAVIYQKIMETPSLLRRCSVLLAEDLYRTSGKEGLLYRFQGIDRLRYYFINYYEEHKNEENVAKLNKQYQDIAFELGISVRTIGRSVKILKVNEELFSENRQLYITKTNYQRLIKKMHKK